MIESAYGYVITYTDDEIRAFAKTQLTDEQLKDIAYAIADAFDEMFVETIRKETEG